MNALSASTLDLATADSGTVAFGVAGTNTYNLGGLQGSRSLANAGNRLAVGSNGGSTTFSGVLSGAGGLTKQGAGSLTLSASNTYTGPTDVTAGTLALSGAGSLVTTGTVGLNASGAAFDISGASGNRTIGALTAAAGSTVTLAQTRSRLATPRRARSPRRSEAPAALRSRGRARSSSPATTLIRGSRPSLPVFCGSGQINP